MAEKRMSCWNCPRYSRAERSCGDGKANPRSKADSVMVAELLGIRALCHYNPFRDRLVALTHFPAERLGIEAVPPRRPRRSRFAADMSAVVDEAIASESPNQEPPEQKREGATDPPMQQNAE